MEMKNMVDTLAILVPIGILGFAVWFDLRMREIPDWIPAALVAHSVLCAALGWANQQWWSVGAGLLLGLVAGTGLYQFGRLGGGDAKLVMGLAAFVGPVGLLIVLFWMAIVGGLLAVVAAARRQADYAYGPAVAAGYVAYAIYPGGLWRWMVMT